MIKHTDIYFFDAQTALKTALEQNPTRTSNPKIDGLQICYYNAEMPLENAPENCIFVPLENVYNYFITTKNRFPSNLSYVNTSYTVEEQKELSQAFDDILKTARLTRSQFVAEYVKEIEQFKPDFSEKPLRVFIPASRETTVMQYVANNIAEAFKKLDYDVHFFIEDNAMQGSGDALPYYHAIHEAKPHIIISINHFNNTFLHDDVFNVIWFQDPMPVLSDTSNEVIKHRKRDLVFNLSKVIEGLLDKKNVSSRLQPFCVNQNLFKINPKIEKKDKIVFIGGSYKENYGPYQTSCKNLSQEHMNLIGEEATNQIISDFSDHYKKNGVFSPELIQFFARKYNRPLNLIEKYVIPLVIRDITILELCKMDIPYEIEVYGWGWEKYEELKPYYKGPLNYGEDISNVYNSATYGIVSHPDYIIQQRTLECAASGCIPIVYDSRYFKTCEPPFYEDNLIFYQSLNELETLLQNKPTVNNMDNLINDHNYVYFVENIQKLIDESLNNE